nr:hypothetical protein [Tanacetum cinerariifolium]
LTGPSEVPQDEYLDSDEDSIHEDNTIPYDQYVATKESQDIPSEASPIPPTAAYMLQTLTDLTTQVEGHRKVIVARNKRNVELKQETELLHTTLRNKEATIASLTSETKTVLSEKKTLEFVPQKELSREQVYWLSASDIASQSSNPPKPVTLFVYTHLVNSKVHTKVWKIKEFLTPFEEVIKKRTAPPSDVSYHLQHKKPTVPVNKFPKAKPSIEARKPIPKRNTQNHNTLPAMSVKARRAADYYRNLYVDIIQFVDRSTKSVHAKPHQAKRVVNTSTNS